LELPKTTAGSVVDHTRSQWSLREMLSLYDRQFVQNAYIVLLKRDPDMDGLGNRLQQLRVGSLGRIEILFRLRYGAEGKLHKVRVKGLVKGFLIERLCRIPLLGYFVRLLRAFFYLPQLQRDTEEIKGLIAMLKNDSDDKADIIVDFQNTHFSRLAKISSGKRIQ